MNNTWTVVTLTLAVVLISGHWAGVVTEAIRARAAARGCTVEPEDNRCGGCGEDKRVGNHGPNQGFGGCV